MLRPAKDGGRWESRTPKTACAGCPASNGVGLPRARTFQNIMDRADRGRGGFPPPAPLCAFCFRPDFHKAPRSAPGRARWRRTDDHKKTKNPAPFRARGLTKGILYIQIMPSPRTRSAPRRPAIPPTNSSARGPASRLADKAIAAPGGTGRRRGAWPILG
jgi:hypothetical protein